MTSDDHDALRRLVAAYAHAADRRAPEALAALFCEDGVLAIYNGDSQAPERAASTPVRVRRGRAEIGAAIATLERYDVTTHFLGQHSADLDGDHATGETYCMAHHISTVDGKHHDHVLSIRYLDRFRKLDGLWRFEERRLVIDWTDERELPTPT